MQEIPKMWFAKSSGSEIENSVISETILQNAAFKLVLLDNDEKLREGLGSTNQEY